MIHLAPSLLWDSMNSQVWISMWSQTPNQSSRVDWQHRKFIAYLNVAALILQCVAPSSKCLLIKVCSGGAPHCFLSLMTTHHVLEDSFLYSGFQLYVQAQGQVNQSKKSKVKMCHPMKHGLDNFLSRPAWQMMLPSAASDTNLLQCCALGFCSSISRFH